MSNPNAITYGTVIIDHRGKTNVQEAINSLPQVVDHNVVINLSPGVIDGFTLSGFVGRGSITINGVMGNATPTTGVTAGAALAGTTSTVLKTNDLTTNDFVGYFLHNVTNGTMRPVLSNTATDIVTHAIGSQAEGDTFAVQRSICDVGDVVITGCKIPITIQHCDLESVNYTDNTDITFSRCLFQTDYLLGTAGGTLTVVDCISADGAGIYPTGTAVVDIDTTLVHASQVVIESAMKVTTEIYAFECTSTALSMTAVLHGSLGFYADTCSDIPLVLNDCPSVDTRGTGLGGATNTGDYGIEVNGNTHLNIASYNTLSGATGDIIVDGQTTTKTYAAIASGGGTLMGDRASVVYGSTYGIITDKYFQSTGDVRGGGSTLFYGFEGWTETPITAHAGGGQGSATQIGTSITDVTTCASDHDSVICWPDVSAGGRRFLIRNSSAKICDIYPPSGGQINAAGANVPFELAAAKTVWLVSLTGTTYKTFGVSSNV